MNAVKWTGFNAALLNKFTNCRAVIKKTSCAYDLYINSINGFRKVNVGEWLVETETGQYDVQKYQ
jgi:hypothetical protein